MWSVIVVLLGELLNLSLPGLVYAGFAISVILITLGQKKIPAMLITKCYLGTLKISVSVLISVKLSNFFIAMICLHSTNVCRV